jgi:hypothetical protein
MGCCRNAKKFPTFHFKQKLWTIYYLIILLFEKTVGTNPKVIAWEWYCSKKFASQCDFFFAAVLLLLFFFRQILFWIMTTNKVIFSFKQSQKKRNILSDQQKAPRDWKWSPPNKLSLLHHWLQVCACVWEWVRVCECVLGCVCVCLSVHKSLKTPTSLKVKKNSWFLFCLFCVTRGN